MEQTDLKICLISAFLLTLGYPPFPLGILAPLALAIFLNHIIGKEPSQAFRLGYILGVFWGSFTLFWIASNTLAGSILAILINSLHYGFIWWLVCRIYQKKPRMALWSFPILWVAVEYLRHFTDLRFNWLNLAYTQTYYLPYIQFIEWSGYLALSLIIVYTAVLLYLCIYKKETSLKNLAILMLMVIVPLIYGYLRMHQLTGQKYPGIRIGIVQPNVDPFEKWEPVFQDSAYSILERGTLQLAEKQPQLIIWPETATPFFLRYRTRYLKRLHHLADSLKLYLITGTPDYEYIPQEQEYHTYNAAFFFAPGRGGFEKYYKIALVPAAESMPFKKYLPFLRKVNVGGGDFFSGTEFKVFKLKIPYTEGWYQSHSFVLNEVKSDSMYQIGVSTIICFESVFPHLVKEFVRKGANLLTVITNDGWFSRTSGPYQHAQYAVFRAIENRVSIARSANTGISFFIDPVGRIYQKAGLGRKANLFAEVPITQISTFYTRHGDWLGLFCLILSFSLIFYTFRWKGINKKV